MGKASWSGMAGSEYPVTFFDFSHVTVDATQNSEKKHVSWI
jgi:hypothetical protein